MLASIGVSGIAIDIAARWLDAILFGTTVLLAGLSLKLFAPKSFWLPILGSAFTLTAVDILNVHTLLLSEPLSLFFTLGALMLLAMHLERAT